MSTSYLLGPNICNKVKLPPVRNLKLLSNPLILEKPRIPIMLKNLIPRAITMILRLINQIFTTAYFPKQ
jgi:peptidoglycan biosynthesis protein MviN/MurJ (putative lipid II flippase)